MREDRPRRVVPKWRSSAITAGMPEARATRSGVRPDLAVELAAAQSAFERQQVTPIASELMFLANEAGHTELAIIAANKILESSPTIKSQRLLEFAQRVVDGEGPASSASGNFVQEARKLLAIDYRNPVLLIDVARELTVHHHERSAERYIRAAIALAPQSRFVVRSAARFYLHVGEHERAHSVLLRSPLVHHDPWVQASEIAVATVRGRNSVLARKSLRAFSESKGSPIHHAELISAVATVELNSGAEKSAKKLFQRSLSSPNDNSLAQAEWAAQRLNLVVDSQALLAPMSFEAHSKNAYRRLLLEDAIRYGLEWAADEPFAARPAESLGHFYCVVGDYAKAHEQFARILRFDESERFGQQLNLLFTRIHLGDTDEAFQSLMKLSAHPQAITHTAHLAANLGALAYVTGDHLIGREYYNRAIQIARAKQEPFTEAIARAYYARAARDSFDPLAESIKSEMLAAVKMLPSAGALYIMSGLETGSRRAAIDSIASKRVATRQWTWDQVANVLKIF